MWRELVQQICKICIFFPAATQQQIAELEASLRTKLSVDLISLLFETNGIGKDTELNTIFSVEKIKSVNLDFRSAPEFQDIFAPFDLLLFFAEAGNGDYFAFEITNNEVIKPNIWVWNHEDDGRRIIASSLDKYLIGWLSGNISI